MDRIAEAILDGSGDFSGLSLQSFKTMTVPSHAIIAALPPTLTNISFSTSTPICPWMQFWTGSRRRKTYVKSPTADEGMSCRQILRNC